MKKKVGPFPLWAWLVVAAVGGYIIYRVRAAQAEGGPPEVEGYFPAEHREPGEGEPTSPGGGLGALGEELGALRDAGFVPAGSEEAKAEPPEREVAPAWWEELAEGLIKERLAGGGKGGRGKQGGRGKRGKKGKQGGRGKGGGKHGKGGSGKRQPSSKNPRHTHQPSHTPSRHPGQRIGVGKAKPAARARAAAPKRRPPAAAGGRRRRR